MAASRQQRCIRPKQVGGRRLLQLRQPLASGAVGGVQPQGALQAVFLAGRVGHRQAQQIPGLVRVGVLPQIGAQQRAGLGQLTGLQQSRGLPQWLR